MLVVRASLSHNALLSFGRAQWRRNEFTSGGTRKIFVVPLYIFGSVNLLLTSAIPLAGIPSQCFPVNSGPLSLAIPLCVGEMSTGGGFGHRWGRISEFCVGVSPATGTAGILALVEVGLRRWLLIWADMVCMLTKLGLTLAIAG